MKKKQTSLNDEVVAIMFKVISSITFILVVAVSMDIAKLFS